MHGIELQHLVRQPLLCKGLDNSAQSSQYLIRTFNQPVRHFLDRFSDVVINRNVNWIIIIELGTASNLCEYLRDLCKVLSSRNVNGFRHNLKCFRCSGFSLMSSQKDIRISSRLLHDCGIDVSIIY